MRITGNKESIHYGEVKDVRKRSGIRADKQKLEICVGVRAADHSDQHERAREVVG